MHDRASRKKLLKGAARHYAGDTLFDRIGHAVCQAECVPRKELHESWQVAKRVRRRLKGERIVDLACGHGLVAMMMALLDDRASEVVAVDRRLPKSAGTVAACLHERWPHLETRVRRVEAKLQHFDVTPDDLIVSAHACGRLTDVILDKAIEVGADVAVLPCCSSIRALDSGGLEGWLDAELAIDVMRAARLSAAGYTVWTQTIPADITPKNRLLLGRRAESAAAEA